MKLFLSLLIPSLIVLNAPLSAADSTVPLFKHCNQFSDISEPMENFTNDLAQELGRRIDASIKHFNAPTKRCINMLKTGEIDFMIYSHETKDRAKFMNYILTTNDEEIIFLTRKNDGDWLRQLSDLENKTIAVVDGIQYFEKLSADSKINKKTVLNQKQLPNILMSGRVDAFPTYKGLAVNILAAYPDIAKASYGIKNHKMSFLIVSKKSLLQKRIKELNRISQGMFEDGYLDMKLKEHIPGVTSPFSKTSDRN